MKNLSRFSNIVKHPLLSGSVVMIAGSMGVNVINYLYHLIMGRMLGPTDYGTLASIFALLYIITIIPTSASNSIVKFVSSAKTPKEISAIYSSSKKLVLMIAIILSAFILFFSNPVARFLNIADPILVVLVSPVLFLTLITLVNQATLQGMLKFTGVTLPNLTSSIGKLIFGIILVVLGWSVFGVEVAIVLAMILTFFLSEFLIRKSLNINLQKVDFDLKPLLKYSMPVLLIAISYTSFFTTDLILVKHFFSPFEAGVYASLSTLGKVIYFASQPITAVMFPIVSKRHAGKEKYEKILFSSLLITIIISFGIVLIYWLFSNLAITILFGNKYLSAKNNLVWMGLFIAFYSVSYLISNFYLSIGKTKVAYLAMFIAILQVVSIWFWHSSLFIVILTSLVLMIANFIILSIYLLYNFNIFKK